MGRKRKRKESLWARKKRRYEGSKKEKKRQEKKEIQGRRGLLLFGGCLGSTDERHFPGCQT